MPGDLSLSLNNALTGLNVNQQQLAILSQNIANANTPGYSRQTVNQSAVYLAGVGEGVSIDDITRKVDQFLTQAIQGQNSTVGQTSILNTYNSRIQLLIGSPGNNNSIDSYVDSFFNAIQSLAQTPQDTTLQQGAINSGVTLATQMNQLATGLQNLQYQADQDIGSAVTKVNNDLQTLGQLNVTITKNTALGEGVSELQDQRDSLLQDISQYMNISTFVQSNGSINVTTGNGVSILDNNTYQISYNPVGDPAVFSDGANLPAMTVSRLDDNGNPTGTPVTLVSSGTPSQVTSVFSSGQLSGLLSMRDQQIPNILSQLDNLAASVRDQFNAIQNSGSGFPGANSLTGTRAVFSSDTSQWSGNVQIAVLDSNGQPVASPYSDEPNGVAPLNLDLSTLNTGSGAGDPSVQGIINAINQYYGVPQNKAEVGNLNNIQLVSASKSLPSPSSDFSFGLNLDNISATGSNVYVTGVTVTPNTGGSPTVTSTAPVINLATGAGGNHTYITQAGSPNVIVQTSGTNNLTNGETVFLSTPPAGPDSGTYDGIPPSSLGGYFKISNVTSTGFQITADTSATSGETFDVAAQTATPPYATAAAGQNLTTLTNGLFTANLSGATNAQYYDVTVSVGVDDGSGNIKTSNITYRVNNNVASTQGSNYGALSATGDGTIVMPNSNQPIAKATLVDANGNELPKVNGVYTTQEQGFLKIQAGSTTNFIAINSLDSQELGHPNNSPPVAGTNRGFSYYFDLNDFFASNPQTTTGDTVANSALNMQVEQRLQDNPSLVALGQLTQSPQPDSADAPPNYTFQLNPGDNSVAQQLAALGSNTTAFSKAGGLGASVQTFSGYAGQVIGTTSTNAAAASTNSTNAQTLLDGFTQQASAISGVNLDTELANTVIYQNAYAASARIVTVASTLFDTLLQAVQ